MTEFRMYLLVRTDLTAPIGKWMVQAGHAFSQALYGAPGDDANAYYQDPKHTKIALAIDNELELHDFVARCKANDINHHLQIDLGMTVFPPDTPTCLAIGPITKSEADRLLNLGKYPLLK